MYMYYEQWLAVMVIHNLNELNMYDDGCCPECCAPCATLKEMSENKGCIEYIIGEAPDELKKYWQNIDIPSFLEKAWANPPCKEQH